MTALVGDNGAGKSTLVKAIAGIYPADNGEYLFDGKPVSVNGPKDAAALGIEVVYQDLALCENLDIVENMFLGREIRKGPVLDETTMERKAREVLGLVVGAHRQVGTPERPTCPVDSARPSPSRKSALWNSRVVLLDEPTAALGVAQTAQVLQLVRRLADSGVGVMLISHNLTDVFQVADRITALYLGRVAADVAVKDVTSQQVVELITTGKCTDLDLTSTASPTA